jgi:DNA-binding GntR family transcriptional regulator
MGESFGGGLTEHAYYSIRNRILRGALPFGAGLSRRSLAEEMGISIVPVGDALQRLENEGFVESRPRVGTRVRIPTPQAVRGHYILREALESQAARLFALSASPAERTGILRSAAQLDDFNTAGERTPPSRERLQEIHDLHMRFHLRIAQCTGCEQLCHAIEKNQVLVFNWLYDPTLRNQQPPHNWHSQLAEALAASDPEQADRAMRRHTRYRMDVVMRSIESLIDSSQSRWPRQSAKTEAACGS